MPKKPVMENEKQRRIRMLKESKIMDLLSQPFRCEKCSAPVDPKEFSECWNCSHPRAIDTSKSTE